MFFLLWSIVFVVLSVLCICYSLIDDFWVKFLTFLAIFLLIFLYFVFVPIIIGGFIAIAGIAFPLTGEVPEWMRAETVPTVYVPIYSRICVAFFIWTGIFCSGKTINDEMVCLPFEEQPRGAITIFVFITVIATTVISLLVLL